MKKIKIHGVMFFVGILICAGISVAMFFIGVKPLMKFNNIINNGTEAQATIVDFRESNTTVNDEVTYNLKVEFTNEAGTTVTAWTLDYFDYYKTGDLISEGVITIRYIDTDVVYSKSLFSMAGMGNILFSVGCVVTGLLAVFLVAMAVKTVMTAMSLNGLLYSGNLEKATFVEQGKFMMMGNTKYYSVVYEYKDGGQTVKVTSPKNYTENEVTQLKEAGVFDIKTKGSKSIIAHEFN